MQWLNTCLGKLALEGIVEDHVYGEVGAQELRYLNDYGIRGIHTNLRSLRDPIQSNSTNILPNSTRYASKVIQSVYSRTWPSDLPPPNQRVKSLPLRLSSA